MTLSPTTPILLASLGALMGALGEGLCFLLVYKKQEFVGAQKEVKRLWREFYALEAEGGVSADGVAGGRKAKALAALKEKIQKKNKALTSLKQRGNLAVGVLLLLCMPLINSFFEGSAGAFFPFTPFLPFSMFSMPNAASSPDAQLLQQLQQETPAEPPSAPLCTASGVFMLAMMLTKTNLQMALGAAAPGGFQQQAMMQQS